MQTLHDRIRSVLPDIVRLRRELHTCPELAFEEHLTAKTLRTFLGGIPDIVVEEHVAGTGIIVSLGPTEGPVVALRADMDALPIEERTGAPHASKHPGVMHACGHDGHMAILAGAVAVLAAKQDQLRGPVRCIFQPAEEKGGGASSICNSGALDYPSIKAIFGLHGWPWLDVGRIGVRPGAVMGSADQFLVTIRGEGGHAAAPHQCVDSVMIAGYFLTALQSIVARSVDPRQTAVVTVGKLQAGSVSNIIAESAILEGTVRTLDADVRVKTCERVELLAKQIAAAFGATAEVSWLDRCPVLVNSEPLAALVSQVGEAVLGAGHVEQSTFPVLFAEDFAVYAEHMPACFFALGLKPPGASPTALLHQATFDFNDDALPVGIGLFCSLVEAAQRDTSH